MMRTVARRIGFTIAAGVVLGATWSGTASAATTEHAAPAIAAVDSGVAAPAASGRKWCGFDYDTCEASRLEFVHYGYQTSPLYWAGTDNTCAPESQCNGYYFDWWE